MWLVWSASGMFLRITKEWSADLRLAPVLGTFARVATLPGTEDQLCPTMHHLCPTMHLRATDARGTTAI